MKKTLLAIATAASFMLGGAAHAEDKLKVGFITSDLRATSVGLTSMTLRVRK